MVDRARTTDIKSFIDEADPTLVAGRWNNALEAMTDAHGQLEDVRFRSVAPVGEITDVDQWREAQPTDCVTAMKVGVVALLYGYEKGEDKRTSRPESRTWQIARQIGAHSSRLQLAEARVNAVDYLRLYQPAESGKPVSELTADQGTYETISAYLRGVEDKVDWWIYNHGELAASRTSELVVGSVLHTPRAASTIRSRLGFEYTPEAERYIDAVLQRLGDNNFVTNDREVISKRITSMYEPDGWQVTPEGSEWLVCRIDNDFSE